MVRLAHIVAGAPHRKPHRGFEADYVDLTNLREQLGEETLGRALPQGPPGHCRRTPDAKGWRIMTPKFSFVKLKHTYWRKVLHPSICPKFVAGRAQRLVRRSGQVREMRQEPIVMQ